MTLIKHGRWNQARYGMTLKIWAAAVYKSAMDAHVFARSVRKAGSGNLTGKDRWQNYQKV